jgi:hypothetical protein
MGARVNFIFDDGTDALVVLYSHWGADSIHQDLQSAFSHAAPRLGDHSYWTRMVISWLTQEAILEETGYGIFAISRKEMETLDNWGENVIVSCETATHNYVGSDSYV